MTCPNLHRGKCYNDHLSGLESSWDVVIAKNSDKGSDCTRHGEEGVRSL